MKGASLYSFLSDMFHYYLSMPRAVIFSTASQRRKFQEIMSCYYNIAVGLNLLASRLKDMFMAAGLDSSNINNHGLKASGITQMYSEGLPDKLIMERSGQFISLGGVWSYERTSEGQKMAIFKI